MVKGCALCHAAGLAGRWLNHVKTHGHCVIHGEDSWFCFTETRSSHSPVDRICAICILTCALNSKFTVQTVGPRLSILGFDDCSFVPEPNTTAFCYLRLLLQAGCSASVKPLWPTFLEKLCCKENRWRHQNIVSLNIFPLKLFLKVWRWWCSFVAPEPGSEKGASSPRSGSVFSGAWLGMPGMPVLRSWCVLVIFLVMMISCIPQYIMCIIALYIWYAHYAYMKHGLIYVLLHHNHLYRRRQWKPWKRSERKVCFWSMTRSRAHQRGKNLVVKRNRKTHIVSFWTKTDERICGRLEYGQSMNYNQFLRPTRVQVEKVFGDPKSSLEGTSSPEVCSCSSELSHVSSNMLPRGHGRYTVYVEKKTLARK